MLFYLMTWSGIQTGLSWMTLPFHVASPRIAQSSTHGRAGLQGLIKLVCIPGDLMEGTGRPVLGHSSFSCSLCTCLSKCSLLQSGLSSYIAAQGYETMFQETQAEAVRFAMSHLQKSPCHYCHILLVK